MEGIADGNEGVGRTAGRKRTRVGERLQIIYVVGRAMLKYRLRQRQRFRRNLLLPCRPKKS